MNRDADLQRAYELIEADSLEDARAILGEIVAADRNNADAWWLLTYAVDDPQEARNALSNVLRIDANYPGAQTLLATLDSSTPAKMAASSPGTGISRLPTKAAATVSASEDDDFDFDDEDALDLSDGDDFDFDLDDVDDDRVIDNIDAIDDFDFGTELSGDDDDFDSDFGDDFDEEDDDLEDEDEDDGSPRRRLLLAFIALLVLIVVVAVVFVVKPFGTTTPGGQATSTQQVSDVATNTPDTLPTADPSAATIDSAALEGFYTALSAVQVLPDSGVVESTALGNTLSFTICVESRRTLPTVITDAIRAIAGQSTSVADQVDAVGARFVNCADNNSPLRHVVVSMIDALDFASGTLSAETLNGRLQVIQP